MVPRPRYQSFTVELVCKGVIYLASAKTMKLLLQKKKAMFLNPLTGQMVSGQRLAGTRYWRREVRVRLQNRLVPLTTYLDDIERYQRTMRRLSDVSARPLPPAHATTSPMRRPTVVVSKAAQPRRSAAPSARAPATQSPRRRRPFSSVPAKTLDGNVTEPTPRGDLNCCCVCQDAKMDAALIPCSHVCACQGCAAKLLSLKQRCPVCRLDIASYMKVYIC